ncbi:hypothetical protein H8K32_08880 [Undibacterium jejuense]|uniref:Uncharacterized protein n=1 Tax=Undibacterium jejuense TaxID=1344949 RepID=A0A923HCW1_9BURK|nr:protein YgfX [Undibacterium jejuense]MBC3862207.1 hypothetical protein [Undibacterium jejuense]
MSITLNVVIKPSRIVLVLSLCMCALASLALYLLLFNQQLTFFSNSVFLPVFVILFFSLLCGYVLRKWRLIGFWRLDIASDGAMVLRQITKENHFKASIAVSLSASAVIWNDLMVLHMLENDLSKRTLIVMRDSLDALSFQHLRVSLLWARQHHLSGSKQKNQIGGNF